MSKDLGWDTWQEPSLVKVCQDGEAPVLEEMEPFPEVVPRRRSAKSFSSLRHPVDGIVAFGRRLSVTLRSKSSKQNLAVTENVHDDQSGHEQCEDRHYTHVAGHAGHKRHIATGSWDARVAPNNWPQGYSINRRPSLNSVSALHGFYAPTASVPIPGRGQEPPILPNNRFGGAAARAAAAAQNEQLEVARMAKVERESAKILEMRIPQDSESGIGIDLRDRSEVSDFDVPGIRRLGKNHVRKVLVNSLLTYFRPHWLPSG
jgi:F-box and WD-40 domain protein 1/11